MTPPPDTRAWDADDYCEAPCKHHPITTKYPLALDHLPHADNLNKFVKDVSRALKQSYPRTYNSVAVYDTAHILFLRWDEDDLGTQLEIDELRSLMQQLRFTTVKENFTTNQYDIPSKKSSASLEEIIVVNRNKFAADPGQLLIIYYGGHGKMDEMERCVWYPWMSPPEGHYGDCPEVDWTDLQSRFCNCEGDVVFILDCCYASSAAGRSHAAWKGHKELLVASGKHEKTKGVNNNSFTRALIRELKSIRGKVCTLSALHSFILQRSGIHGLMNMPIRIGLSDRANRFQSLYLELPESDSHTELEHVDSAALDYDTRVLISIRIHNPSRIEANKDWIPWLLQLAPPEVADLGITWTNYVRPEAGFHHESTLLFFSMPITVWNILPFDSAYSFIDIVKSGNLLSRLHPVPEPETATCTNEETQNYLQQSSRKTESYDKGENHKSTRRALTADVLIERAHKAYEKYCQSGKKSHIHHAIELATGAIRRATAPPASWSLNLAHYLKSRYEKFERPADLDRAVLIARRGIAEAHEDCQGKSFLLNTLAALLLLRYARRQAFPDLGRAIQAAEKSLAILPRENRSAKPMLLNTLASVWNHVHTHTGKLGPLNHAIQVAKDAASCATIADLSRPLFLYNYLILVNLRYTLQGEVSDLEEAISEAGRVIMYLADGHPLKPELLSDLGVHLNMHYECTKEVAELNKAIQFGRQAMELVPNDSPRKAIYLGNLSNSLLSRHRLNSDRQDLEESIRLSEAAANAIPKGHESEPEILHNLATKRMDLYRWTGQNLGFESAVEEMRQRLATTPENHHAYAARLNDFTALLFLQFEKTGTLKYLNEAIKLSRRSMQMTPADHPDQSIYADNLGYYYAHLYDSTQNMRHLDIALACAQVATGITPRESICYSTTLGRLGAVFERRYERTGSTDDLQKAIHFTTNAADASPKASMEKAAKLSDLGTLLEKQYLRTGAILYLNEAIARSEEAIQITPRDHATLSGRLNNQAIKLIEHHSRTGLYHTIDEAFHHVCRAVELTSRDQLDWAMYTSTLASVLHSRYELSKKQEDLAKAIDYEREARDAVPKDHVLRMTYQHNLGISLSTLYQITSDEKYLSEAIGLITESVESAPHDSPLQAERKNTLASLLETHYRQANHTGGRKEILSLALEIWNCTVAVPFQRIKAGYRALRMFAEELQSETQCSEKTSSATDFNSMVLHRALNLGVAILELLPVAETRYLERKDQQFVVSSFSGVASLAAYLFLEADKISEAVECLERGRTVMINQLLSDRKDISNLARVHPDLATKYTRLVTELNMNPCANVHSSSTRRKDAVKELEICVNDIRAVSGSGMLHLAHSVSEMQQRIGTRLIIFVNVNEFGSHAVIFSTGTLMSMELPELTASKVKERFDKRWTDRGYKKQSKKNSKLLQALEWLWNSCVGPILFRISPAPCRIVEALPRVWWIGTGLASSLPFHAAERRSADSTSNAFSWVVSSYTPSIMSLIHAIQNDTERIHLREGKRKLLLATMPTTPSATRSYDNLQVAEEAISVIQSADSYMEVELLEHPAVEQVLEGLKACHIAHFVCHEKVDRHDPSNTALIMQRRGVDSSFEQDLLTAQKISGLNLEHAHIAYLSTCSASENRARRLTDEVIHLASGFLVAGFPNVIGSLWQFNDSDGVDLATYFYAQVFDERRSNMTEDVAVALHKASQRLRNAHLYAPARWAQFVHWGV